MKQAMFVVGILMLLSPAFADAEVRGAYTSPWDADDESVCSSSKLVVHDFRGEFVICTVDDELPAPPCAQVVENAVELVLAGDAGHSEGDHHAARRCEAYGSLAFRSHGRIIPKMGLACTGVGGKVMLF